MSIRPAQHASERAAVYHLPSVPYHLPNFRKVHRSSSRERLASATSLGATRVIRVTRSPRRDRDNTGSQIGSQVEHGDRLPVLSGHHQGRARPGQPAGGNGEVECGLGLLVGGSSVRWQRGSRAGRARLPQRCGRRTVALSGGPHRMADRYCGRGMARGRWVTWHGLQGSGCLCDQGAEGCRRAGGGFQPLNCRCKYLITSGQTRPPVEITGTQLPLPVCSSVPHCRLSTRTQPPSWAHPLPSPSSRSPV